MILKLVITATKDHDPENPLGKSYEFADATTVNIGRGEPNDIPLTDPGRTVSRNHARIVVSDDGYLLEDLNSKNFTYLNEERIEFGQQRRLQSGDTISVGDFSMECFLSATPRQDLDATIIDQLPPPLDYETNNPFIGPIEEVFESLKRVCDLYDLQPKDSRGDYLNYAIQQALPNYEGHRALTIFVNSFSDTEVSAAPTHVPSKSPAARELPTISSPSVSEGDLSPILDAALASLKQLIRIPYEFRGEFIGHTMWQDEESTFLYEGDYTTTKNYLLDSRSSPAELNKKLERLKKASEKVAVHQVGMLEGYRAVVREGLHQILLEMDPAALEKEVLDSSALFKIFPMLGSKKVLDGLKAKIDQMKESDWGVTEQRVYRPVFIRAYMAAISEND